MINTKGIYYNKIVVIVVGAVDMLIKGVSPCRITESAVNKMLVKCMIVIHKSTGFYNK